jgi:hypothetical protein
MKRYLILLFFLFGTIACTQNPEPPIKSTMDPANAEATTAAFLKTREAKTMMPTAAEEAGNLALITCTKCVNQGNGVDIWEFPGLNSGNSLITVADNTRITILDKITADDDRIWYQVEFNGTTGWVIEDFIQE